MKSLIPRASSEALEILKLMFKINPKKRPTASQLLQERYFRGFSLKQAIYDFQSTDVKKDSKRAADSNEGPSGNENSSY